MIIPKNTDNLILLIRYMARDGFDENEIIKKLNITKSKFRSVLKEHDELKNEMEYAKQLTDFAVEDALLKKALGTTSVEIKETEKSTGVEKVKVTKELPADTQAMQFWLKNRCPDKWNDKTQDNQQTDEKLKLIFAKITNQADEAFNEDSSVLE